ncbi:MAG: histidine--tRNA ligase [Cytophagales bacterium]|nr:histidine--tRNA ligase [Cytophagales bacterium]
MNNPKPSIPKGTRDFGPSKMVRRNYIFDIIKSTFEKYGFEPLETPAMENLTTLIGKYGEEESKLIFNIIHSGDLLTRTSMNDLTKASLKKMPEQALRYDLTVPFARYVAMNRNDITFPFKRYQIQPVWRAERPQKGRYREFYQCDVDVIGSDSLLCEAEMIIMIDEILTRFGIKDFTIKINHRKILKGVAEMIGERNKESEICVAIDKLNKIGEEGVKKELADKGLSKSAVSKLMAILEIKDSNQEKLNKLKNYLKDSAPGIQGLQELHQVFEYISNLCHSHNHSHCLFDTSLARGLAYYTGTIFEAVVNNVNIGSVCGGGRYDDLTGSFGLLNVSGIGFSFGVDRLYVVLEELKLFREGRLTTTAVMVTNFDEESEKYSLNVLTKLRSAGINSEIYPQQAKLKKQMDYANKKSIPYVILIGSEEIKTGKLTLRDMNSGEQEQLKPEEIIGKLSN